MGSLIKKLILPLALTFALSQNVSNSSHETSDYFNEYYKRKLEEKKEFYESTIRQIFPYINNMTYMWDIHRWRVKDFWQTPGETYFLKTGDCEDFAIFANYILKNSGLDIKLVRGKWRKESKSYHVWNEYEIGDTAYIIETASKSGCKILNKNKISEDKYIPFALTNHDLNLIKDFEDYSGIDLVFKNPVKHPAQQHSSL